MPQSAAKVDAATQRYLRMAGILEQKAQMEQESKEWLYGFLYFDDGDYRRYFFWPPNGVNKHEAV